MILLVFFRCVLLLALIYSGFIAINVEAGYDKSLFVFAFSAFFFVFSYTVIK